MTVTHITAPDGSLWQLVPVELTAEMQTAAAACWDYWQNGHVINAMWPDMLAAAPEFGGVAVAYLIRHSDSPSFQHIIPAGEMDAKFHAAIVADKTRSVTPLYTHPPAADEAMGRDVDVSFTADEVNECFDVLIDKGPRLIPEEIIEEMRGYLLEAAAHGMPAAAMRGGESGE